ncbi:ATP-binding protein [Streptomyces sp. NPDC014006]|uniref:ATP-binding protein n=1 Tax=Streptomyces sp. NPDC014006 TaxID=3364870 RepID=UPI0036FD1654
MPRISLHLHHRTGSKTPDSFAVTLKTPCTADMPRIRGRARDFLAGRRMPDSVLDDALLVVSELLTNAVLHALPPAVLQIHCDDQGRVHIEVTDGGPCVKRQTTETDDEHGRGLYIVAALCASHGTITRRKGVTRWARIDL